MHFIDDPKGEMVPRRDGNISGSRRKRKIRTRRGSGKKGHQRKLKRVSRTARGGMKNP